MTKRPDKGKAAAPTVQTRGGDRNPAKLILQFPVTVERHSPGLKALIAVLKASERASSAEP